MVSEEKFAQDEISKNNNTESKPKNYFETKNKMFFNTFAAKMLESCLSISLFVFQNKFKNLKVFGDHFKLTNSDLKVYLKDSPQ